MINQTTPTPNAQRLTPTYIEPLIGADEIARRVRELGVMIARDYPDPSEPLLLLGILKGAAIFAVDLARAIPRDVELDFVQFASYGSGTVSSGQVRVVKPPGGHVQGKHVIVVEDILDTGLTLRESGLLGLLGGQSPLSVRVCALLDKPVRRQAHVPIDYRGFTIPDRFVVGYGMDFAERYRNLPYVGILRTEMVESSEEVGSPEIVTLG